VGVVADELFDVLRLWTEVCTIWSKMLRRGFTFYYGNFERVGVRLGFV
jgi:hypothetical protein